MLRFLAAFLVLFLGAAAGISLLPNPPKAVTSSSAVAAQLHSEAAPAEHRQDIRVVYPASDSPSPARVAAAQVPANPAAVEVASVYPQAESPVAAPAQPLTAADASAQAGTKNVNLNTASIEELNNIPGVGHIGRTIASHRPYRSVEDLLRKRVVRKSVYDRIKDQVAAQ